MIQFYGYFYVHFSGQRLTGTMVHVMSRDVIFRRQHDSTCPRRFHYKRHHNGLNHPIKHKKRVELQGCTNALHFPIQYNGNYWGL